MELCQSLHIFCFAVCLTRTLTQRRCALRKSFKSTRRCKYPWDKVKRNILPGKPTINVSDMADLMVFVGDVISFDIGVSAEPEPECSWSHNKTVVKPDKSTTIKSTARRAALRIQDAKRSHCGTYQLSVTNSVGSTKASANVTVIGNVAISFEMFCCISQVHNIYMQV